MLRWQQESGVDWHYIQPGKAIPNAYVASFNGGLREECLSATAFHWLDDARELIAEWPDDYNCHGPHTSLGGLRPAEFANRSKRGQSCDGLSS